MKRLIFTTLICLQFITSVAQNLTNKTEILVLGTPHLDQIKKFEPPMLKKVIHKLESMNFDVVCIEKMPGQLLYDIKSRNDKAFTDVIEGRWGRIYFNLADTVQEALDISYLNAHRSIVRLLKKKALNQKDRKNLFYNYIATTDLPSAALQYQYIRNKDIFTSGLDKHLVEVVKEKIKSTGEFYSLALPLAYSQKLDKIIGINDFQDEALLYKYFPEFGKDYQDHIDIFSKVSISPVYLKMKELTEQGIMTKDLSNLYLFLNSKEYVEQDFEAQWKIWLETDFPSGSDRARYSLWEMRNLLITANILKVASLHPSEKILVIIGSSHKGFIEKYLSQIADIQLVNYQ